MTTVVHEFFDRYARALLARDEKTVADMYAIPSLILFPGHPIAVADAGQTEKFFAAAWDQYDGVNDLAADITLVAETTHSAWADVTWHHDGAATERHLYQLIDTGPQWKIAVLTPLGR
jgi:hypothetical protein